jgi:hypothetical protein
LRYTDEPKVYDLTSSDLPRLKRSESEQNKNLTLAMELAIQKALVSDIGAVSVFNRSTSARPVITRRWRQSAA